MKKNTILHDNYEKNIKYRITNLDWEKWYDNSGEVNFDDSLEQILRKRVTLAIKKGASSHYLWSDIDRCKCKSTTIREILQHVEDSDIKPKNARKRKPGVDEFLDAFLTEVVKIYLRVAQNSFRYIAEANERNEFLAENEYQSSDRLINRTLGRARSLVNLELSWRQSFLFYNNLGIYLLEKGRYEERLCNKRQAEELYKTASRVHEMAQGHLTDCSNDVAHSVEGSEENEKSQWYTDVDCLILLRNLIDLGRTRQHLYRLHYEHDPPEQIKSWWDKNRKKEEFEAARGILLRALKISTRTKNFICRAEAHLALADLYAVDEVNWGSAIIAYRCSIETFTKDEYIAYHDKVCDKLADFYTRHRTDFDKVQRSVFIKSFNLCDDFDKEDMCKRYRLKGDFHQHIRELFERAPDECPEITCGRCNPHYWSDC